MTQRWWHAPVLMFFAARLSLVAAAIVLAHSRSPLGEPSLDYLFCRLDCLHYVDLTVSGYAGDYLQTPYFPGFFLLAQAVRAVLPIDAAWILILIANAAGLASFLVLHRIFTALADEAAANMGLALFAFYPFAFFQACGYPESLAILLTALAVWWSFSARSLPAGAALGAAVLMRHLAALAGLSLLVWEWARSERRLGRFLTRWQSYTLLVPVLSILGYCVYCKAAFGDPIAFLTARQHWGPNAWRGVDAGMVVGDFGRYVMLRSYVLFGILPSIGTVWMLKKPSWRVFGVYSAGLMLTVWLIGIWGAGRYSASCWPAFLALGDRLKTRPALAAVLIGVCALLQFAYFFAYTQTAVL